MAQAHRARLLAQPQNLNEQIFEGIEIPAPELTDAAVVRLLVAGQHPEGQVLVAGPPDFAGGDGAHAVGVEQQERQPLRLHPRVKPLLAAGILGLSGDQDLGEIQLIHQIQQEIHLVVF
jgi:hypothetical protein